MAVLTLRRVLCVARTSFSPFVLAFVVLAVTLAGYSAVRHCGPLLDEANHNARIESLRDGTELRVHHAVCFHNYHHFMAFTSRLVGIESVEGTRLLTLLFSLLCVPVAFGIARKLDPEGACLTTAQFFFLPVVLPFLFLIYTDALTLLFILLGVWLALEGWMTAAALASITAVLIRQTAIVWLGFVFLLPYVREHGLRLRWPAIGEHLRRGWLFLAGVAGFAVFVLVNKGVAVGDATHHPTFEFRTGNIFFALVLVGVVFLPLHVANLAAIGRLVREKPWWLLIAAASFACFWFTSRFDHPYNAWEYCLRNKLLLWMAASDLHRALVFGAAALTVLSLAVTPLREPGFLLIYPVAAVGLAPCWLIDPRYAMPVLALFTLFRVRREWAVEWACLAWCAVLSLSLLGGMVEGRFFP